MIKNFKLLLGEESPLWTKYLRKVVFYGILSGLTITFFIPVVSYLLQGNMKNAVFWFIPLLVGMFLSLKLRQITDEAGIRMGEGLLRNARHRIGDHVATLPIGWFTPDNNARLSHVISKGIMEVAQLPAHLFTPIISGSVAPLVLIIALFILNPMLGIIALVGVPIIVGVLILAARLGEQADREFNDSTAKTSERIVEFAQAQSVLRAFSSDGSSARFLESAIETQKKSATKLIIVTTLSIILGSWVVQTIFALLFGVAVLWLSDLLQLGVSVEETIAVVVALILINRFIDPLQDVANYGEALRSANGHLKSVGEIFAEKPLPMPKVSDHPKDGSIELDNLSFSYGKAGEMPEVLSSLNLTIKDGSMVAIVGSSGSGKTTLMRLIARFFDVTKGAIRIGDVDVRDMNEIDLSKEVSQIFQSSFLFQGTIGDNIWMGNPHATHEAFDKAIEDAGITEMIARLPKGLDTLVGEGGARLSGGERQRISIARALLKDAKILLVDEATAALDAENQAIIAETLAKLRGTRTLVVIAHQLSTIQMADQILVLDKGQIAEQGSHEELVNQKGIYAQFWQAREAAKGWKIA